MQLKRPALFLDRDGVINQDHHYVIKKEDFEFIEGIFEVCRHAKQLGYLLIVVTNQAGIGRGYYTEQDFLQLMDWMCRVFRDQNAPIDKIYYCPSHPEAGIGPYKTDSPFRKPAPGMILQAAQEYSIDLSRSVLIGDKESDILAGTAAGVGCNILYLSCPLGSDTAYDSQATVVIDKLTGAIPFLSSDETRLLDHNARCHFTFLKPFPQKLLGIPVSGSFIDTE
jgi:D-glycero-D-manno-heptose 1,7-bisphosphate phosphatase